MVNPAVVTSFSPSPSELIEYLRREIAGNELHDYAGRFFIKGVDVYSAVPCDLVRNGAPALGDDGVWYFIHKFSNPVGYAASASRRMRRPRTVAGGKGRWRPETRRNPVRGRAGGYMTRFTYLENKTTSSGKTVEQPGGWLMLEYGIDGCDTVIAKIYVARRRLSFFLNRIESRLMADDDEVGGALDLVESQQGLPHYTYFADHDNASQAIMGTWFSPSPTVPPPLLAQGMGQYPAGQHVAAAAAAAASGQGAGHYPATAAAAAGQAHHMVPSAAANAVVGQNQTVLGAAQAHQVGMLAADVVIQPHIASTSGGLPNHLELDQFAFDDGRLMRDYYYTPYYYYY